jgi:hypothetical protein
MIKTDRKNFGVSVSMKFNLTDRQTNTQTNLLCEMAYRMQFKLPLEWVTVSLLNVNDSDF